MVDKLEIFYIMKQLEVAPPLPFPETIVVGFGFLQPVYIQFQENNHEFFEINSSDAKCISICWNSNIPPCFMIKLSSRIIPCNNVQIIDISRKNTVYQQYIHGNANGKYRLSWSHNNITNIIAWESKNVVFCTRKKINRLSNSLDKKMKSQLQFILKILNKTLHYSHGAELKSIELDFILSIDLYCIEIHSFICSPILSLHKIQTFPSLLMKSDNLEGLKNLAKPKSIKPRFRSAEKSSSSEDYLTKLKTLNKQMRVIMNKRKAHGQLIEGLKSEVNGILNLTSPVSTLPKGSENGTPKDKTIKKTVIKIR